MIAKSTMMAGLLGAALLAGCASDEPVYSYYNPPVYRVPRLRPKRVYPAPRPPVVYPNDDSAPEPQPSPEPDNPPDVAQRAPDPPAPIRPPPAPPAPRRRLPVTNTTAQGGGASAPGIFVRERNNVRSSRRVRGPRPRR